MTPDLLRHLDDRLADGIPFAIGLEIGLLVRAVLLGPMDEACRQSASLRRFQVAVLGGDRHDLVRLRYMVLTTPRSGFGVGL